MADVLILGLGPAGISSALYALRGGLSVELVGKDFGALENAHAIENYYGLKEPLSGRELAEIGRAQAEKLGAKISFDEVLDLMFDGKNFVAQAKKNTYRGKSCILATGASRKKVSLAGLSEFEGRGVSYCAVCDAFFFRGKKVAVLGSGEYALHEASELLPVASSVTILSNGEKFSTSFDSKMKIEEKKIQKVFGENFFEGVLYEDGQTENFDGLFCALGSASALDLLRKAGAAFDSGSPILDENFQTTIPGLFAAGDCTGGLLQISVAVGEGAKAGLSALQFVRSLNRNI